MSINLEKLEKTGKGSDTAYGGNIVFRNKGKAPASNVVVRRYITTDMDKTNRDGQDWYDKNMGGLGSPTFIAPDVPEYEQGFRSLSPAAEFYYFESIVTYEGLKQRKYWTRITKIFHVDAEGNFFPVYTHGDWDKNSNFKPEELSSQKDVVKLLANVKDKKTAQ